MPPRQISRRRTTRRDPAAAAAATAAVEGVPPPAPSLAQFDFVPVSQVKPPRRKPGTAKAPKALRKNVVFSTGSQPHQQYTQASNMPLSSAPGTSALANLLAGPSGTAQKLDVDDNLLGFLGPAGFDPDDDDFGPESFDRTRHRLRRLAQHETWRDKTVPALIRPFLAFSHGQSASPPPASCSCSGQREYTVTMADWDSTSIRTWKTCRCASLVEQLVGAGYFPCAPKRPSLAFSFRLLELISLHSLHVAPNVTAWAATLEKFWDRRGYLIREKRAFRRRLGNALQWYQVLLNRKDHLISTAISHYRSTSGERKRVHRARDDSDQRPSKRLRLSDDAAGQHERRDNGEDVRHEHPAQDRPNSSTTSAKDERKDDEAPGTPAGSNTHAASQASDNASASRGRGEAASTPDPSAESVPSQAEGAAPRRPHEYLRKRCHLCYGGKRPSLGRSKAHVIVCIDANFAQKRRKSKYSDPALHFEESCFVSPAEVAEMEEEVERKRKRPPKARTKSTSAILDDNVLDECESSFIAAQEKVTKASKNYYSDTALMALLCHHDKVLFVVNMTTPGERQHYALVLLKKLFAYLPLDWNVGLLYDIACQLSRSMEKFDLLGDLLDRLSFGVSVFHAYGHQWACQLVFHPRKREGFGLSDGEGCERFWSAIRSLIPCLRVSGYFRRLFVLDRQISHIQDQNTLKFGRWLARKSRDTARRLADAELSLEATGLKEEDLRAQWSAQKASQLQPAPRQSKYAGDKELDKILLDLAHVDELRQELRDDRTKLRKTAHKLSTRDVQQLSDRIEQAEAQLKATRARIDLTRSQLGTGALRRFESMRGDAYLRARVNARAVRVQIRMSIQAHKFEREKLERNYRRHVMQNKDHAQMRDLVNAREKNLGALVRKFNSLVSHMELLVKESKGPRRRMRLPRRLDSKKLFRLDVDDDIWQEDPGLGPQNEGDLPAWQIDAQVRRGIRAVLEIDRCREEQERLLAEAQALSSWWSEECVVLDTFCATETDQLFVAEARLQRSRLDLLGLEWNADLALCDLGIRIGDMALDHDASAPERLDRVPSPADTAATDASDDDYSAGSSSEDDPSEDEEDVNLLDAADRMEFDVDGADSDGWESPLGSVDGDDLPIFPASPTRRMSAAPPRVRRARAFSPSAIDLASSDDDTNDNTQGTVEQGRVAGKYTCSGDDVLRIAGPTRWLSGSGLSVFAESHRLAVNDPRIGHLPSTFLVDVREYSEAVNKRDNEKMQANLSWIERTLRKLPPPSSAKKWLITAHITSPQHWTLVEVRWDIRQLRFYDSMADSKTYALQVRSLAQVLLNICERYYDTAVDVPAWEWVPEQRPRRQTNWYDCGAFVAADFVSLLRSDVPSSKRQEDMKDWRVEMAAHMRRIDPYVVTRPAPLTAEQEKESIYISD